MTGHLLASDVWRHLETTQRHRAILAPRALSSEPHRLLAALSHEGAHHFLLEPKGSTVLADERSRGFSVQTRILNVDGEQPTSYIDIECKDLASIDAFDLIGRDL